jgi:hypothetical protein
LTSDIEAPGGGLSFCLYRSIARPGLDDQEVEEILQASRRNNPAANLTGCLHFEEGIFLQWLEGPRFSIFRLLDTLQDDYRHMGVKVLDQGPLKQRFFQDWQMRFSDRQTASLMEWLGTSGKEASTNDAVYARGAADFLKSINA